jgi:hypothetical protein
MPRSTINRTTQPNTVVSSFRARRFLAGETGKQHRRREDMVLGQRGHAAGARARRLDQRSGVARDHIHTEHDRTVAGLQDHVDNLSFAHEMAQRGLHLAALVHDAAAREPALEILKEDHRFAALPGVGEEFTNLVKRRRPADERQVLPLDRLMQLTTELGDALVPIRLRADGDRPPESQARPQRFHVLSLHHARFIRLRLDQQFFHRRSRLRRQPLVPGFRRFQTDRAARGVEEHQRHGGIAQEQLVHQLVFVLASQVPEKDLAVLPGWRSAIGMELGRRQGPDLHALRGGLAFHVPVFGEAAGEAGLAGRAVPGEHHLSRGLQDLTGNGRPRNRELHCRYNDVATTISPLSQAVPDPNSSPAGTYRQIRGGN